MPKGGARTNSGPAPDPNALRRERDQGEWTTLPSAGREGDAPDWPLENLTPRESELWAGLWAKPQALMWERFGQQLEVALYVRNLTQAEMIGAPVSLGTLVRQFADSLGLTTPGLRNNRWKIGPIAAATQAAEPDAPKSAPKSARARLTVVPDAGAA